MKFNENRKLASLRTTVESKGVCGDQTGIVLSRVFGACLFADEWSLASEVDAKAY